MQVQCLKGICKICSSYTWNLPSCLTYAEYVVRGRIGGVLTGLLSDCGVRERGPGHTNYWPKCYQFSECASFGPCADTHHEPTSRKQTVHWHHTYTLSLRTPCIKPPISFIPFLILITVNLTYIQAQTCTHRADIGRLQDNFFLFFLSFIPLHWSINSCQEEHQIDTGDFTTHGQPVPRPDRPDGPELPTFSYGGEAIPRVLKQYRFSPHRCISPIWWSNQLNQSERRIYAPLTRITTDPGNGLVSARRQTIAAWTQFSFYNQLHP